MRLERIWLDAKYCVCSEWKGSGWTLNIVCVVSGKDLVGR